MIERTAKQLIIEKMTEAQYAALTEKDPTHLYLTPDDPASTTNLGPVKVDGTTIVAANDGTISAVAEAVEWGAIEGTLADQTDLQGALDAKANQATTYTKTEVDTALAGKADASGVYTKTEADTAIAEAVAAEADLREAEDENLQDQIDAITAASDVVDVVATKAALDNYDTSKLTDKDIIKVLQDETHNNATTYYRWGATGAAFEYIGAQGPFYTKGETDTLLNAKANQATTYTKTEVDAGLAEKADADDVYTKTEADALLADKADADDVYDKTEIDTALGGKVDKETGKGLSTNDYTTAEKNKLAGIEAGAEVNDPLYTTTGQNTDGAMTQKAVTDAIAADYAVKIVDWRE